MDPGVEPPGWSAVELKGMAMSGIGSGLHHLARHGQEAAGRTIAGTATTRPRTGHGREAGHARGRIEASMRTGRVPNPLDGLGIFEILTYTAIRDIRMAAVHDELTGTRAMVYLGQIQVKEHEGRVAGWSHQPRRWGSTAMETHHQGRCPHARTEGTGR